jgi:hypothetical protein
MKIKLFFRHFCSIKKDFKNFKQFDKEEDSIQDKYKDFSLDLKKYQEIKKKEDQFFSKKYYEYNEKSPIGIRKIAKELINRNFLKKTQNDEEKHLNIPEFDIETLKNLNQAIMVYELNEMRLDGLMRSQNLFWNYVKLCLITNAVILGTPGLFFKYNTLVYCFIYGINMTTIISYFSNYKMRSCWVVEMEYIHKDLSVKMKLAKVFRKGFYEIVHKIDELELYEDDKLIEFPIGLKVKGSNQVYVFDDKSIWYQSDLFYNLFKH